MREHLDSGISVMAKGRGEAPYQNGGINWKCVGWTVRPPAFCASSPPWSLQSGFILLSDWMFWDSSLGHQLIIATQMLFSKLPQRQWPTTVSMLPQAVFWWESLVGEALLHVFPILLFIPAGCLGTSLLAMAEVQEGKYKLTKTFEAKAKLAYHHSTLFCWPKHVLPNGKKIQSPIEKSMHIGPLK